MLIKNLETLYPSLFNAMGNKLARRNIFLSGFFASSKNVIVSRCFFTTKVNSHLSLLYFTPPIAFSRSLLNLLINSNKNQSQISTRLAFLTRKFFHVYFLSKNLINLLGLTPDKTDKTGSQSKKVFIQRRLQGVFHE